MDWSPVEYCQTLAGYVWRGERLHLSFRLGGLNSEQAVRMRLQSVAHAAQRSHEIRPDARELIDTISWNGADPLTVLEQTESLVGAQCQVPQPDEAHGFGDEGDRFAGHLLIVQCIAGRLGRWAVRDAELPDAKLARTLHRSVGPMPSGDAQSLIAAGEELFRMGQGDEAAKYLLNADRVRRNTATLFKLAVCLWKCERYADALWAIRACLLEDIGAFESPATLLKAQMVESSLRAIAEKRTTQEALEAAIGRLPEGSRQGLTSTIDRLESDAFDIDVDFDGALGG